MLQGFSREHLCSLFKYDRETGLVTRRVRQSNQPAGKVVGSLDGKGYLHVCVDGMFIRLHRLVWFIETGVVPAKGVDHRNNVRTDNRWCNLREAGQHGNSGNIGLSSHNTSGMKGVSWNAKRGLWNVQIKKHGVQTYLGSDTNICRAALRYNAAAVEHFGEFAQLNDIPDLGRVAVPVDSIDLYV